MSRKPKRLGRERLVAALSCDDPECACHDESRSPRLLHCPFHDRPTLTLSPVRCEYGCNPNSIMLELQHRGLWGPDEAREFESLAEVHEKCSTGFTLRELGGFYGLSPHLIEDLGLEECTLDGVPAIRIPYLDVHDKVMAVRYQTGVGDDPELRVWRRGDRPMPYDLRLLYQARRPESEQVILVDDELAARVLWLADIPAVAIPRAAEWNDGTLDYLWGLKLLLWPSPHVLAIAAQLEHHPWGAHVLAIPEDERNIPRELRFDNLRGIRDRIEHAERISIAEHLGIVRDEEWAELEDRAEPVLAEPDPLARVEREIKRLGYGGDVQPALVVYLAATSRLLKLRAGSMAVHMILIGPPSGGKSWTIHTILRLLPAESYHVIDAGSPRALIYDESDLRHRVLVFGEADSLPQSEDTSAASAIRNLLQDNFLHYQVTEKSAETGGYVTRDIRRDGPTVLLTTCVKRLGEQLMTRLFTLEVADHPAQTQAALRTQARLEAEGVSEPDPALVAFQQYLQARAPWDVVVPYASSLADALGRTQTATRTTRDFSRLLSLVKALAVLRHAGRKEDAQGRVIATLEDYATVRELINRIYEDSASGASKHVRETVEVVARLASEPGRSKPISLPDVAGVLQLSRAAASRRIKAALAAGWLVNREARKGFPLDLALGEDLPAEAGLPLPETLVSDPALESAAEDLGASGPLAPNAPAQRFASYEERREEGRQRGAEIERLERENRDLNARYRQLADVLDDLEARNELATKEHAARVDEAREISARYAANHARIQELSRTEWRFP